MSVGRYLFCWVMMATAGGNVYFEQWALAVISIGMALLVIGDAIVGALKDQGRK